MNRLIIPTIKMPSWISSVYDTIGQPSFGILSDDMLKDIAGGKVKDTKDKEWWEYLLEALEAAGHCFTGECLVSTPEGEKAIREIQKGDEVISLDEEGNKRVAKVALCITPKQMPIVEGLNVMFINGVAAEGFSTD